MKTAVGLGTLLERSLATGRLSFDVDAEALSSVDVVSNPVLVNRSTAPVGTAEYIRSVTAELRGGPRPRTIESWSKASDVA